MCQCDNEYMIFLYLIIILQSGNFSILKKRCKKQKPQAELCQISVCIATIMQESSSISNVTSATLRGVRKERAHQRVFGK